MTITIHIKLILWLIAIYALIYVVVGMQQSNFYSRISSCRAETASTDRGDIQIGILYMKNENSEPFLNGVNLAIDEINNRTNSAGGKGILFRFPDGKTNITRKITPVFLPVQNSSDRTIASPLVSSLKWKKHLVAIVNGLTTNMTLRTRVIPEYYGIAVISVRSTLPALSQEDFKYFVRTVPNYNYLARYFMSDIPLTITRRSGKKITRIGIFFNPDAPDGYLEELIAARESVNERIEVVDSLRSGFASGILNEINDIEDLKGSIFLQTALNLDQIQIERFISNNLSEADRKKPVSLKTIVDRYAQDDTPTKLVFIKSFLARHKDYRPLITMAEQKAPDLIVINSGIPDSLKLIRQIREMGIYCPVMVSRINEYEALLGLPSDRLTNVYGAAMYDPDSKEERFSSFKDRYEAYLRVKGRPVTAPGFLSIQGYEAVHLIAQVIEKSGSAIPMNICNTLKYAVSPLEGKVFKSYSFSPEGDILDRKLYTIFFDKGTMTTLKEQE